MNARDLALLLLVAQAPYAIVVLVAILRGYQVQLQRGPSRRHDDQ